MSEGFEFINDWIIFKRNGIRIYGFYVKQKGTIPEKEKEPTDYDNLIGNKQGNAFMSTQINYEGNGKKS